jgi:hypothetical protein
MKTFICTTAFILTTIFSFANGVENNLLKSNRLKINSSQKVIKYDASTALTLSYDVATFCAGARGISKPKVSEEGGSYKNERVSDGIGALAFNVVTGLIDHSISDAGTYKISYTKNNASVTTIIIVNNCK